MNVSRRSTLFVSRYLLTKQLVSSTSALISRDASSRVGHLCTTLNSGVNHRSIRRSDLTLARDKPKKSASLDVGHSPATLRTTYGIHIIVRRLFTSSYHSDSEVDRISLAYLQDDIRKSVQKHDGNRLIYEVRGQSMLRVVSLSFYATAAFGLYLAPDLISSAWENEVLNLEAVINLTAVAFAVVGLPGFLRMLSRRLILKLYFNEARETYVAVTQALLLTNKMTKFSLDDVVVNKRSGLLHQLFNLTSFKAKRRPFHVNPYNFKLPSDYNHLLGFD